MRQSAPRSPITYAGHCFGVEADFELWPPLSRQIRMLEDELGAALFARTARGMRLLPAGAAFLRHARTVLAEVAAARRAVVVADQG